MNLGARTTLDFMGGAEKVAQAFFNISLCGKLTKQAALFTSLLLVVCYKPFFSRAFIYGLNSYWFQSKV